MIYITRKFSFSAAHRVYNPALSDEENAKIYGKCSNPNGHGHNYVLKVTVAGEIDESIGYVMDLTELRRLVDEKIINKVDHKNINADVDFMQGVMPSTENLAVKFWREIEGNINNGKRKLFSIMLQETDNNSVEYRGE